MSPFPMFVATAMVLISCPASFASSYYPYLNAEQLYKMQRLANAYEYPGDRLSLEGLGGGALDVPYDMMGGVGDGLVDIDDEAGPAYWPEQLVAELAAAAERENEEGAQGLQDDVDEEPIQEDDVVPAPAAADVDEAAATEEDGQKVEQEEEDAGQEPQAFKDKHSGAQLRDQEHLEHSALHGYQSVSGGTVNAQGKQTKSDKALPAYCNPPNPCPVGKTAAEDNCVENFVNSAENNQRLLSQQECPCDTEHMFTCPEGGQTVSSKAQGSATAVSDDQGMGSAPQDVDLDKVIAELSGMEGDSLENNPNFSSTHKRMTLVAKKSPHFIGKRSEKAGEPNPFLFGQEIKTTAKKSPNLAKNNFRAKQRI